MSQRPAHDNADPHDSSVLQSLSRLNLNDAAVVADCFHRAAEAARNSSGRTGATCTLPDKGTLIMTGDLHDHGLNFQRIVHLASLDFSEDRHLILHELIHGEHQIGGRDLSVRMLARVAALKLRYPDRVHILLGNHELAQIVGDGILKGGVSVVDRFNEGVEFIFGNDADQVQAAMAEFIRSMLLAVRCPNGILCSHSLPSARQLGRFDFSVLKRELTDKDLSVDGSAYMMVWGRNHDQALLEDLADDLQTRLFVTGHQPVQMGYERVGDYMLILGSDSSHGMALPIDLSHPYDMDELVGEMIPLASIVPDAFQ